VDRARQLLSLRGKFKQHCVRSEKLESLDAGIGREECLEELISYTQEKNIYIRLLQPNKAG
jgi:hypothetical protein